VIIDESDYLAHYGILRRSGRYPWGSGGTQSARNSSFLSIVDGLRKDGMSETDVAKSFKLTTTQLRALRSIAGNEQKLAKIARAQQLKDKGLSNKAIGEKMGGINESSVRSLLAPGAKDKADILLSVSNHLKSRVDEDGYIDIGTGTENYLNISNTKLKNSVAVLEEQGYVVHPVQVPQATGGLNKTTVKVLTPPGTTYKDAKANIDNIKLVQGYSEDGGRTVLGLLPPIPISSKRIAVVYGEEGKQADGMIYVRPGSEELSLGKGPYAQVRVAVDGTHYIKGMAVYKDDLPKGVDLVIHTPKANTGNKLDAMKPIEKGSDNPFGSMVRQITKQNPDGSVTLTSAMNLVGAKEGAGESGSWDSWSRNLPTQLLSKQAPKLAQQQLDLTYERKQNELKDIMALTNPTVRRVLLEAYADSADSSAVHLKAAALPRQATKVLLPIQSLKPTEVYAPSFNNGEIVALVRYPHGGKFEIPELVVNNRNREARKLLGSDAPDAVGINHKVAERLSGADFDGDTVVVIPNNNRSIKSEPALKKLKDFDPQRLYKLPDDSPRMSSKTKGQQMGLVSNLITDMTIKGAPPEDLARAVKHSMVVIDAEKHRLDYKRSAVDNGIRELYVKYQNKPGGGGSTLISKAKSDVRVADYKKRSPKDGGPIDPKTGKIVYESTPQGYTDRNGNFVVRKRKSTKLAETTDAATLLEPNHTRVEKIYADHSNRMKGLANDARKEVTRFKPPLVSKSAKQAYSEDVKSLNAKLDLARRNKPLERQSQIIANTIVTQMKSENPNLDSGDIKKLNAQALTEARRRTGAEKFLIRPSLSEWAAIQAGAVSYNQLNQILQTADLESVKQLATPKTKILMSSTKTARAKSMLASGYTQAEVASSIGVSLTTLKDAL
jgi:hypothetical protein